MKKVFLHVNERKSKRNLLNRVHILPSTNKIFSHLLNYFVLHIPLPMKMCFAFFLKLRNFKGVYSHKRYIYMNSF